MKWTVYDNTTDEVIGIWNKYEHAVNFWNDHIYIKDTNWELFPWIEVEIFE